MSPFTWYRCEDYDKDSFNCILLKDFKENRIVESYHVMIKEGKMTQIMKGDHHCDRPEVWHLLDDYGLVEKMEKWRDFVEAKSLLSGKNKLIVSINNNKLSRVW